jgi:hypothetical protein
MFQSIIRCKTDQAAIQALAFSRRDATPPVSPHKGMHEAHFEAERPALALLNHLSIDEVLGQKPRRYKTGMTGLIQLCQLSWTTGEGK